MRAGRIGRYLVIAGLLLSAPLAAQTTIPIRTVKPDGKFTETFTSVLAIKQFRTGEVLVNDGFAKKVLLFDANLVRKAVVTDSTGAAPNYGQRPYPFIEAGPDSVFLIDQDARTLVMVGPSGKLGRAAAFPKMQDAGFLFGPPNPSLGATSPGRLDARGRLIYRGQFRPPPPQPPEPGKVQVQEQPDTAPLLRGDFDTRTVDTLGVVKVGVPFKALVMRPVNPGPSTGTLVARPIQTADGWTVLTDGTIAIVRAHDYHVDWIDPDGTKRSTPKMDFAWRRLTDAEKKYFADSAIGFWKKFADSAMTADRARGNTGGGGPTAFEADPIDKIPDYIPPIGGIWPDADNHLWILPTTSYAAKDTRLFDVIDRNGKIIERVQVPAGTDVVGFGPGGVVYLARRQADGLLSVERVRIVR